MIVVIEVLLQMFTFTFCVGLLLYCLLSWRPRDFFDFVEWFQHPSEDKDLTFSGFSEITVAEVPATAELFSVWYSLSTFPSSKISFCFWALVKNSEESVWGFSSFFLEIFWWNECILRRWCQLNWYSPPKTDSSVRCRIRCTTHLSWLPNNFPFSNVILFSCLSCSILCSDKSPARIGSLRRNMGGKNDGTL